MTSAWREYSGTAAVFIAAPAAVAVGLYAWPGAPDDYVRGAVALTAIGVLVAYVKAGLFGALSIWSASLEPKALMELGGTFWLWGVGVPAALVFAAVRGAIAVKDAPQLRNMLDVNLDFLAWGTVIYGLAFGVSFAAYLRRP